jgi:hypothetical protein
MYWARFHSFLKSGASEQILFNNLFQTHLYEGYSESNLRIFLATNVEAGESSRMQGSITWLIAL